VHLLADAAHDTDLSSKASASPWDPVHSSSAPNGAHAVTGGNAVAGAGIDDEFDLLSSRSKSPPTTSTTSAGTCSISLLDSGLVQCDVVAVQCFGHWLWPPCVADADIIFLP